MILACNNVANTLEVQHCTFGERNKLLVFTVKLNGTFKYVWK